MSDDTVGYGKPPKHSRFKPGQCPNKRGRPKKRQRFLLPRQLREDILRLMEEDVLVETPDGPKKVNSTVAFYRSVRNRGIRGNATCTKMWENLMISAVDGRLEENGPVRLLDAALDNENRKRARLHTIGSDPDYDIRETTKDIY